MSLTNDQIMMIIGGVAAVLFVVYMYNNWWGPEHFTPYVSSYSPFESQRELNRQYDGPTAGIKDYLVDTMVCSKKCCGDQWPVPFEGLSAAEVEQTIATQRNPGPFVRTNYSCANGIEGVGCPCVNAKAYEFIVNHGRNAQTIKDIEPTFFIRGDVDQKGIEPQGILANDYLSPYEVLQAQRSMFVDSPKMNDLQLQRSPNPITNVQSVTENH